MVATREKQNKSRSLKHYELPLRWTTLRPHAEQRRYYASEERFNVVPAGRRSGKTEIAKRRLVRKAILCTVDDGWFVAAAPVQHQANRIFWRDLKKMIPRALLAEKPSDGSATMRLINGATISVVGLDKPERIEGPPLAHIVLDEYGNMKESVWPQHVRPALADTGGTADFIGVPEGRNHYYHTYRDALTLEGWAAFYWKSKEILPQEEIDQAANDLDELTFKQEMEAEFVTFAGQAYYAFDRERNIRNGLRSIYDPRAPLIFCYDFNVDPGVAAVVQEVDADKDGEEETCVIGEVWIPRHSNTPTVNRKLIADWGNHQGKVYCYGDATGGARNTSSEEGTDWDLIRRDLKRHFSDVRFRVPRANPAEKGRINAMNSRLQTADGTNRMYVDEKSCPHLVEDFEGVRILDGFDGEIDKKTDPKLSHLTDALGYYVVAEHPVRGKLRTSSEAV